MKRQYLEFSIKHQKIERTDTFEVVGGSRGYLWARFTFCDDWSDETIKYAVFTGGGRPYPMLIENGVCEIPWEVLRLKRFYVGCIAGELLTTNPARVDVGEWCLDDTDPNIEPTPTMFYAIMKSLESLKKVTEDEIAAAVERYMQENPVEAVSGIYVQPNEPTDALDGSLWIIHPTESNPKGISLYYAGENEADLKNAPNGSVWLAPKSSNKPATPEGGSTEEKDPTVPEWAKQPNKPTYTAAEVGAATPEYVQQVIANLPTGGSDKWEFIGEFNVGKADVAEWIVDKDADEKPISLKQMYFEIDFKASASTTAKTNVLLGNPASTSPFSTNCAVASKDWITTSGKKMSAGEGVQMMYFPCGDEDFYTLSLQQTAQYTSTWNIGRSSQGGNVLRQCVGGIAFQSAKPETGLIGANSTVKIWGVRI